MTTTQDQWSKWLLETRFGGDEKAAEEGMRQLRVVRDRVLRGARLRPGDTLLDVGAGDGLIAFGALELAGQTGRVIFSDISQPLLDHTRRLAEEMGVTGRCAWLNAGAEDLGAIEESSVDAVTTRSVLIFVSDKAAALREFHRVLKPGGRISLFEPINRFEVITSRDRGWGGRAVDAVRELAERLHAYYSALQPLDSDPMLDFDERDLVRLCEEIGFSTVRVDLRISVGPSRPRSWESMMDAPGNPRVPAMAKVMEEVFTPDEAARFEAHLRPLIEGGGLVDRGAVAFLRAVKAGGDAPPYEEDDRA